MAAFRIPVQLTQGYKTDPIMICKNSTWGRPVTLLCIMIGAVLYPWVNGDPLNPGFRVRIPVQLTQGYKTDPIMICKNSTWAWSAC